MANYRRIATGNWTNLAHWEDDSGGSYVASSVLPGPTDVVYANGFTVTLDIDVIADELRTTTAINVNQGGVFLCGVGNTITANLFAGNTEAVRNSTTNTKTIIGNVVNTAAGQGGAHNQSTGTLNIIGNVFGGGGAAVGALNRNGLMNITGNCTGGNGAGSYGVWNALFGATGTVIIIGTCIGGSGTDSDGGRNGTTGVLRVTTAQSGPNASGVWGDNINTTTIVENLIWGTNGIIPVRGFVKFDNTASKSVTVVLENNTTTTLVDPSSLSLPAEADVRDGITYASGSQTGTLIVPSPSNVRKGVPTDNTVGTAELTAADFWDYLSVSATTVGSMGEVVNRIPLNPSSVQSTGAQIASFNT
jgi:hypothetical protein